jgi:hypothetical protein
MTGMSDFEQIVYGITNRVKQVRVVNATLQTVDIIGG